MYWNANIWTCWTNHYCIVFQTATITVHCYIYIPTLCVCAFGSISVFWQLNIFSFSVQMLQQGIWGGAIKMCLKSRLSALIGGQSQEYWMIYLEIIQMFLLNSNLAFLFAVYLYKNFILTRMRTSFDLDFDSDKCTSSSVLDLACCCQLASSPREI